MTNFEGFTPPGSPEEPQPDISLAIPEEINEAWCQEFGRRYGDGSRLTLIPASMVLFEQVTLDLEHKAAVLPSIRRFDMVDLHEVCDNVIEPPVVSGRVLGAIRIPFESDSPDGPVDYVGHVILDEVELGDFFLASLPGQRMYVPIEGREALLLFT